MVMHMLMLLQPQSLCLRLAQPVCMHAPRPCATTMRLASSMAALFTSQSCWGAASHAFTLSTFDACRSRDIGDAVVQCRVSCANIQACLHGLQAKKLPLP